MSDKPHWQRLLAAVTCFVVFIAIVAADARSHNPRPPGYIRAAICAAFGPHCQEAINVSGCETGWTWDVHATNGRYWGLFQVSDHWRRTVPGFAWNAKAEALHAYRVFVKTGRTWHHWDCQP